MQYNDRRVSLITRGRCALEFFETSGPLGYLCSSVEIYDDGEKKARLTLVRPNVAPEDVVQQLLKRAEDWLAEYEKRDGAASTGFSLL